MYFYSPSSGGFYLQEIHGNNMPDDVVEISEGEHTELLAGQAGGKRIAADPTGHPTLVHLPLDDSPEAIARTIANRRYQAETAGTVVNGMALPTDRDSQALVTAAALAAVIDPSYQCQWKTASGFVRLDAQQIIALACAMRAHVQACFDREAELLADLESGTYSEEQLGDGWLL